MAPCIATSDFPQSSAQKGCHAVIDNEVFCFFGPRPRNFPAIPPRSQRLDPSRYGELPDFHAPGWFSPQLPFLGFVPSSNPFKCTFLRCLDYTSQALPIEKNTYNHTYSLEKSLQADWDALEKTCRVFLKACIDVSPLGFDVGQCIWVYPLQYGY